MTSISSLRRATASALCAAALALGGLAFAPAALAADAPNAAATNKVPTTKVVAIGSFTKKPTKAQLDAMVPNEVSDTAWIYMDGKLDQWFARQDEEGVVFLMNVSSTAEAQALLEKLPLGRAGLMKFQLIPVGPLWPLTYLMHARPAATP
jgi:hypothetical protein